MALDQDGPGELPYYVGKLPINSMIIIFGASGGVGQALYSYFLSQKISCIGTCNSNTTNLDLIKLDITDFEQVNNFISSMKLKNTQLKIINCVGITDVSPIHKSNISEWKKVIDINIIGGFNIIKAVLPIMRENCFGKIVHFGSIVTSKPIFGSSAYITSKSALSGLSKAINVENMKYNISSTLIHLGYSELGMIKKVPDAIRKDIIKNSTYKRLCSKEEIIKTVLDILNENEINENEINLFSGT